MQETYLAMVGTYDPQNIVRILERHPFHVDSLLQLSEVNLSMGRFEQAAELVKRALHVRACVRACVRAFVVGAGGVNSTLRAPRKTSCLRT